MMHTQLLRQWLAGWESLRLVAYLDHKSGVWTIAYGHTRNVKPGDVCTVEQAELWLDEELAACDATVRLEVQIPLSQPQWDALVSFVYNCGARAFASSTLLKRVKGALHEAAALQLLRWNQDNGKVMRGLLARRAGEGLIYAFGDYTGK